MDSFVMRSIQGIWRVKERQIGRMEQKQLPPVRADAEFGLTLRYRIEPRMKVTTAVSVADYFNQLQTSDVKLEYHDGEVVAMAGAQPAHVHIQSNFIVELGKCLKAKGCAIMGSDLLVKAGECGNYYFPDLVIVCGKEKYEVSPTGLQALENPEIIVEILSPGTSLFDRTTKLDCYKTIESFRQYVLVYSTKKEVEVITKISDVEWLSHLYRGEDEAISINDCTILLSQIYDRVELDPARH